MGVFVIFLCMLFMIGVSIYDADNDLSPATFCLIAIGIVIILMLDVAFFC